MTKTVFFVAEIIYACGVLVLYFGGMKLLSYLSDNIDYSCWRYRAKKRILHISRFLLVVSVFPLWTVAIGMLIHTIGLRGAGVLIALFLIAISTMWIVFHVTAPLVWLLWHETSPDKRKHEGE